MWFSPWRRILRGRSGDAKPSGLRAGTKFVEEDTGVEYTYDPVMKDWKKRTAPYSALVAKDGSTVWAEDASGKTIASGEAGVDDASVIQSAIDSLPTAGGRIVLRAGEYLINTPIIPHSNSVLEGESNRSTILKASDTLSTIIDLTNPDINLVTIQNLKIDGAGNAAKCIDLSLPSTRPRRIYLDLLWLESATDKIVDSTNSEETLITRTTLKARAGVTKYGFYSSSLGGWHLLGPGTVFGGNYQNAAIYWFGSMFLMMHDVCLESDTCPDGLLHIGGGARVMINQCWFGRTPYNLIHCDETNKPRALMIALSDFEHTSDTHALVAGALTEFLVLEGGYFIEGGDYPYTIDVECHYLLRSASVHSKDINWSKAAYYESQSPSSKRKVKTVQSGTATFSGDGTTTDFEIGAHGLVITDPSKIAIKITPVSSDAIAASPCIGYVDPADNTKIRVKFSSAPASGADNVKIVWYAEVVS